MVNEVVMYQSMFILGVLMFGFFTVSFNNYHNFAEEITLENNMERVLQEIGKQILQLIEDGRNGQGTSGTVQITTSVTLDSEYANSAYTISFDQTSALATLIAQSGSEVIASHSLGFTNGPNTSNGEIDCVGSISSSSSTSKIVYIWESVNQIESIQLS